MKYGDPVHKVLKLLESENINPGNLLIGQTVDVKVIDARNAEFLRPMMVGEFYPDGQVLLKDELTQETIVLQFQWNTNTEGLLYTGESDFGVKYELEINRNLMSNESITKLTESRKLNEASDEFRNALYAAERNLEGFLKDEGARKVVFSKSNDGGLKLDFKVTGLKPEKVIKLIRDDIGYKISYDKKSDKFILD